MKVEVGVLGPVTEVPECGSFVIVLLGVRNVDVLVILLLGVPEFGSVGNYVARSTGVWKCC